MTPADIVRRLTPGEVLPGLSIHLANPGSGLGRLPGPPPYWAYAWAGGMALARHLLAHPELVGGRTVADIGAGSGLVALAALRAGAAQATGIDPDPRARAAMTANARANGLRLTAVTADPLDAPPPGAEVILAGDVFYDAALAPRALAFLRACHAAGRTVLIGDPWRAALPRDALRLLARYDVPDMGSAAPVAAGVFALAP